ncbi:MAG: TonB-dependent receptor [Bacteroidia bacterium]|nr:TonB-dependent receptor [Bacteroidia bacterium]
MKHIRTMFAALALILCGTAVHAQSEVRGKVTDVAGQALPGVAVMVPGTLNGTMTANDGTYSLQVKAGQTLNFSCVGMKDVNRVFDGKLSVINVTMEEDALFLDDVVVVGYGTQKKSSLTSAVSAIKGDDVLKAPSTNVSQILAGRLPGISSVQESGEPGQDQASLRLRGSIYGIAYVVDGFPVNNINDINPNDIESISVLKDGASAAVYGLKGAGGVMIITTKRGVKEKTSITYDGSYGLSMNANFPEFMDGPQFAYYYNMADMMDQLASGAITDRSQYTPYFTSENIAAMTNGDPTDGWDNVDYISKVFGTGVTQKHNITVTGGNDKARYYTSLGFLDQKGNIDNFGYKRYNLRSNIDSDITSRLHFKLGLSGTVASRHTPGYASGGTDGGYYEQGWLSIANQTIVMHPYLPETYNGLYTSTIKKNTSLPQSPLAAIYESGYKKYRSVDLSANATLAYDIPGVEGLQAKISGVYDWSNSYSKLLNTPYSTMAFIDGSYSKQNDPRGIADGINIGEGSSYWQQMVGQASLEYAGQFGKHGVEALALMEVRETKSNSLAAYAKNLPFSSLPEINQGIPTNNPVSGSSGATRSVGGVFRLKYNYADRYLVELSGREDGSYLFSGMDKYRWGFFPSASVAWRMSNEEFLKPVGWLSDLKLRASVGMLGNDGVPEYAFLSTYSRYGYDVIYRDASGNTSVNPAYRPDVVPSLDLSWERYLSYNVGFDATLWNGKLSIEADAFYNYTYDILSGQSSGFPASMGGYYPTYVNYPAIDAKGVDLLLTHKNRFLLAGKPFFYSVTGSITYSKTRWIKYKDNPEVNENRKLVGKTYGAITGWLSDGLFQSEEEIDNSAWWGSRPNVGDIKFVDINGDGKIDYDDWGYFGRSNRPELTFGLNLNFEWNGFDFNAQFTGGALFDVSLTGTYYNGYDDNTIWTQTFKEGGNSPLYLVENAWSIDNPDGTFPRLTLGATGHGGDNGLSCSFWWRDGKYVRLKSAQLGYTFPKNWFDWLGVSSLRVFAEGQNLFTIDGLPKGIDPESPGVNNGYYPQQRLVMGGVTLTF